MTDVKHNPFPAAWSVPLDTDAIHPHALIAAFTMGCERLLDEADRRKQAIDWSTVSMTLRPVTTEENTTRMTITAKRLM